MELSREVEEAEERPRSAGRRLARWLPIGAIALGAGAAAVFLGDRLSFDALAEHRAELAAFRDEHLALAILAYVAIYVGSVALSVPGAVWLTIAAGFLFGTAMATGLTVCAATAGAVLIFLAARSSLGAALRERAGGWLGRVEAGFREGEVSYLLIMRLVPAIPFFVANLAPAFLGVRLRTFAWTTFVGIIPGTAVYASVGSGLGALLDRGERPDPAVIFTPGILGPLLGLAALSAVPLVIRKLRGRLG